MSAYQKVWEEDILLGNRKIKLCKRYTPVTLIPNQQESSRTSWNCAIRRCSELRPDSFQGKSGRYDWIRTAFERQSKDSDRPTTFELHSSWILLIAKSSPAAIEMHSRCIPAHSRRIRDILAEFEVACRFDSPSKAIRMFRMLLECRNGP